MRRAFPCLLLAPLALASLSAVPAPAETLKRVYDGATAADGYDKYLVLETGVTYTGGLWIGRTYNPMTVAFEGAGLDVRIVGHGAILDLEGGEICLAYCANRLDLDDCVILNGDVRFRGYDDGTSHFVPAGSVRHVTFYGPHDYGVRLFRCGTGIEIERNLAVSAVDTGPDFMYFTGYANDWLPTGTNFTFSLTDEINAFDNWSYHGDPVANEDPLRHFSILCDYG
jgi:hypothetical protein